MKIFHNMFTENLLLIFLQHFLNRMKRSSSSASKQNPARTCLHKHSYRPKRTNDQQIKLFCNQPLLQDHHGRESHPWNNPLTDFYKTYNHNNFVQLSRPQSKHAFRKCSGRPETSKGLRPLQRKEPETKAGFYSQYIMQKKEEPSEPENNNTTNIQIIVTKSNTKFNEKKIVRSKFETDLDDEFLQLFAN